MILSKMVYVTINPRNFKHFKDLGYEDISCGYDIVVKVSELNKGSNVEIECQCDNCGVVKKMKYKTYLKYDNEYGTYYCRKCSQVKLEITNIEKYGVRYPLQNQNILEKRDKTVREKYGVDNISQHEDIKDKKIKTNNDKYGFDSHLSNDDIKTKIKKTKMKKKGIDLL